MTKKYFAVVLIIFIYCFSCYADNTEHEKLQNKIQSSKWGPQYGDIGMFLTFNEDYTIKTNINYEGRDFFLGTYKIENIN